MRHVTSRVAVLLAVTIAILSMERPAAQFSLPIPGLSQIAARVADGLVDPRQQPITNSLGHVKLPASFPETFDPGPFLPLDEVPRLTDGTLVLEPGHAYQGDVWSFCFHAGTLGPRRGGGYVPNELEGPKAGIMRSILEQAYSHEEIRQTDIQGLIWAILARVEFKHMMPAMQRTAHALLMPSQIQELSGGLLSKLPNPLEGLVRQEINKRLAALDEELQQTVLAEMGLRGAIAKAASYETLEQIAVTDAAPLMAVFEPSVARGAWFQHSQGPYVRYFPYSYARTRVQIFVPESLDRVVAGEIAAQVLLNLALDLAMPANAGSQRLGMSSVPVFVMGRPSDKEASTRFPSWVRTEHYAPPWPPKDDCGDFAERILNEKYGKGSEKANQRGPGSEYSEIKKACERRRS